MDRIIFSLRKDVAESWNPVGQSNFVAARNYAHTPVKC